MIKRSLVSFVGFILLSSQSYAQAINEKWECALDLHQGDKGSLSLNRSGSSVNGIVKYSRNDNVFENKVSGSWSDNKVDLIRLLDTDSIELMSGIIIPLGTKKMNIGGRYSTDYKGVWSANCDLLSESSDKGKKKTQKFTDTKVTPNVITEEEIVTFTTSASHKSGVKEISLFLGSDKIHTCDGSECKFSFGPLPKGIYSWRVEAFSNDGSESTEDGKLTVQKRGGLNALGASSRVDSCLISGKATGSSAPLAQVYSVKLYGPNNKNVLKATSGFDNGVYLFDGLAEGEYRLNVDTKEDQEVLVSPVAKTLSCKAGVSLTQNFSFN